METVGSEGQDTAFTHKKYTNDGEYPQIPTSAISAEGPIEGITPGFARFVHDYTVVYDRASRRVMVDTADVVPENQTGGNRIAIMRINQKIGGKAVDGYVVDLRYRWPYEADRLDAEGDLQNSYTKRRYKPVPALGIVVKNRNMNQPEYVGLSEAEDAAQQLMTFVDEAREQGRSEQDDLIAEHGGL